MKNIDDEIKQDCKQQITIMLIKIGLKRSAVYDFFHKKHSMYPQNGTAKFVQSKMLQKPE